MMLDIFNNDKEFFKYYVEQFPSRYTESCFSSFLYYLVNELEKNNPTITIDPRELELIRKETLDCNTNAINYLFNSCDEIDRLYPHHIQQAAFYINEQSGFHYGYRTTTVTINRTVSFTPVSPRLIPSRMMSIIDNYHNVWIDRDIFEREALLHILLVQTQPFEDGNKRTAQLVTSFNLLQNGFAPILIKEENKDQYIQYIDENDVVGFANFMRENSMGEFAYINNLYDHFKNEKQYVKGAMSI
jgi:prophage maintenance system killer protein